jgi:carbon-monoxide dehydrogenase medium subunit
MKLPPFELLEPASFEEATTALLEDPAGSVPFAGGTDILVNLREGLASYRRLVSLRRIPGAAQIECSRDEGLVIGPMVTVNRVARHADVQRLYPGVVDAALSLAADQVRNTATVGGNLCSAVPSADMAPILLAHGARLRIASPEGGRVMPLAELFLGPRRTALATGEIVTAIEVPPPRPASGGASLRQGGRVSLSLPIASAAAVVEMDGEVCWRAAIALGSVAPTPVLAEVAGAFLTGRALTPEAMAEAGELAARAASPIDDHRASAAYRLELVQVLVRRALARAAGRAAGGAA